MPDPITPSNVTPANPTPAPAPLIAADGTLAADWMARVGLPPEIQGDKTIAAIRKLGDMPAMIVNGQQTIGRLSDKRNFAFVPKGPDDVEGQKAWNKAAGHPETPDAYPAIPMPAGAPADLKEDPEAVKQWRTLCHQAGLSPAQYLGLSTAIQAANVAAEKQAREAAKAAQDKIVADVKTELGAGYDASVQLGNNAFAAFADEKMMAYAKDRGWLADPMFLRFCANVGGAISPDRLHVHAGGVDTGGIQKQIDELMASKDYRDSTSPKHRAVTDEVQRLFSQLHHAGQP